MLQWLCSACQVVKILAAGLRYYRRHGRAYRAVGFEVLRRAGAEIALACNFGRRLPLPALIIDNFFIRKHAGQGVDAAQSEVVCYLREGVG